MVSLAVALFLRRQTVLTRGQIYTTERIYWRGAPALPRRPLPQGVFAGSPPAGASRWLLSCITVNYSQQVTTYTFKDGNNDWYIKKVSHSDL
jgi:hypothetical protein